MLNPSSLKERMAFGGGGGGGSLHKKNFIPQQQLQPLTQWGRRAASEVVRRASTVNLGNV